MDWPTAVGLGMAAISTVDLAYKYGSALFRKIHLPARGKTTSPGQMQFPQALFKKSKKTVRRLYRATPSMFLIVGQLLVGKLSMTIHKVFGGCGASWIAVLGDDELEQRRVSVVRFTDWGEPRCASIPSDESLGYFHIVRFADSS